MSEPILGALMIYLVSSLVFCFLFVLAKLLNKLWLRPIRIQNLMASQGIRGPSYRFLRGNTQEMFKMRCEAMATPMEISNHIFPKVLPHIYTWKKLYGMIYLTWFGPKAQLVVSDPEMIKVILTNRDGNYPKSELEGHSRKLFGDGLLVSKGEKWLKLRKLANHAFHGESLKGMTPAMIASVEMMLERWRNHAGKEIDVHKEFKLLTSDVISRTAFGSSYLEGEKIFDKFTKLIVLIFRTAFKIRIPGLRKLVKTSDDVEADDLDQGIKDSIIKVIRKREERVMLGKEGSFGSDFLGSLLSAYQSIDKAKKISIDDVIDECKTFYLAGQETTLNLLSWTVFLLSIHTDWQEKAREEVLESFGHGNPSPNGISRLTNIGMIINESLRLYSPVNTIIRTARKEMKLGELVVPADMEIIIPIIAFHHSQELWGEDADHFKPERFAEGVAKATNNNSVAFLPFGLGPRTCVGLNFALNEAKIALSMILQCYRFTLSPNYVHSPVQFVTLSPQHGLQINLQTLK